MGGGGGGQTPEVFTGEKRVDFNLITSINYNSIKIRYYFHLFTPKSLAFNIKNMYTFSLRMKQFCILLSNRSYTGGKRYLLVYKLIV